MFREQPVGQVKKVTVKTFTSFEQAHMNLMRFLVHKVNRRLLTRSGSWKYRFLCESWNRVENIADWLSLHGELVQGGAARSVQLLKT